VNYALQGGVLKDLRIGNLSLTGSVQILDGKMIYGQGDYGTSFDLYAGSSGVTGGVVATIHARSAEGVDDHRIDISRAGDIEGMPGKHLFGFDSLTVTAIKNAIIGYSHLFVPMGIPTGSINEGLVYCNSTDHKLKVYLNGAWEEISSA